MFKFILTVFVLVSAALPAAAEFKVIAVSGVVRVAPPGSDVYAPAERGQGLAEGATVSTGEDGRVTIEVGPKNTIKLRGNAKVQVGSTRPEGSRMKLIAGRIKGVFAGLTRGRKFDLEFDSRSAVASVKGTTIVADNGPDGIRINTVFGSLDFLVDGTHHGIPQGCGVFLVDGKPVFVQALTNDEIADGLSDGDLTASNERKDLHDFVSTARDAVWQDQDVVTQIREDDFAVGRSLRDVHGNLARVDQRLVRPSPNILQVVNLVKRDEYRYAGKFSYTGGAGARFDYLMVKIQFDANLPDNILDWPEFFGASDDAGNGVDILSNEVELANGRIADPTRDTIVMRSDYVRAPDGTRTTIETTRINGQAVLTDTRETAVEPVTADGLEAGEVWATDISRYYYDNGAGGGTAGNGVLEPGELAGSNWLALRSEAYGIGEDGHILNVNDAFNGALQDPIGTLKSSAAEIIISAVDPAGTSLFTRGNIDLIVIPDLILAIASKFGPSLMDLNSGDSDNGGHDDCTGCSQP